MASNARLAANRQRAVFCPARTTPAVFCSVRTRPAFVAGALFLASTVVFACKTAPLGAEADAQASPQALATPAPLSSAPALATSASPARVAGDAGPPPVPLHGDRALPQDAIAKELSGYTLAATLRAPDAPLPAKGPETSVATLDAIHKRTEAKLVLDVAPGRARLVLGSGAFPFPAGTELRGRTDQLGAVLVEPGGATYRVVEHGVLRALLDDRRLDASPVSGVEVAPRGEGWRFGGKTRRLEVTTRAGKGNFELAHLPEAGDGGMVIARALASLLDAPAATQIALDGEVPVRVEITWATPSQQQGRGGFVFEATSLTKRTDLGPRELAVPPPFASFAPRRLPVRAFELFATPAELAALHSAPASPGARGALTLINGTDELRFAWLEGVPIGWLAPRARVDLSNLPVGRYQLAWRSFLGDVADAARAVEVPGTCDASGADAGP